MCIFVFVFFVFRNIIDNSLIIFFENTFTRLRNFFLGCLSMFIWKIDDSDSICAFDSLDNVLVPFMLSKVVLISTSLFRDVLTSALLLRSVASFLLSSTLTSTVLLSRGVFTYALLSKDVFTSPSLHIGSE